MSDPTLHVAEEQPVADITLNDTSIAPARTVSRERALKSFRTGDSFFRWTTFSAAMFVLLLLGAIIASLIIGAWPALSTFGFGFITTERWSPAREIFGALAPIY